MSPHSTRVNTTVSLSFQDEADQEQMEFLRPNGGPDLWLKMMVKGPSRWPRRGSLAAKPGGWPEFGPLEPRGERGEPTLPTVPDLHKYTARSVSKCKLFNLKKNSPN